MNDALEECVNTFAQYTLYNAQYPQILVLFVTLQFIYHIRFINLGYIDRILK